MINFYTTEEKIEKLVHPCRCRKCEHPCRFGSGAFRKGETKKAAAFLGISKKEFEEKYTEPIEKFNTTLRRPKLLREEGKPYGQCIFYENGCRIHEVKPYECRIAMGCKPYGEELIAWFDLKHFFNPEDAESLRQFRIYAESGGHTLEGCELKDFEEQLKKVQDYDDIKKSRKGWTKEIEKVKDHE